MKYRDVVSFEPIESIVQLREADEISKAEKLVETFVISDRIADSLLNVAMPHLRFDQPGDNKGLMIVGNYGTGKSHLMSVISSILEHETVLDKVQNSRVKDEFKTVAGRFKVLRTEIGSTTMSLRDILVNTIEGYLESLGVEYVFPQMEQVTNNKDCLMEMMSEFQNKYPQKGFLVVVDELLDFLRTRNEKELILDLNFLREIGEVCKLTRFRFIAGVQESLFDSPRFQFVAESLRRVKDRFEQVRIAREDVAYVVANRLLKKDDRQKALIRKHLEKFTGLYEKMAENIERFVELFPVHPAYLDVFERVYIAEKREVLKTLSYTIKGLIDSDIPDDDTGLISFDIYWKFILDNPSLRSIPEVREVVEKSERLEGIIETSFVSPIYKPTAVKIIHALSVYRLATGDIRNPIGLTAKDLRDGLCIYIPNMPVKSDEFLLTNIETVLQDIIKTVSGQFISYNKENGQYYLDLEKNIDYEAEIRKRADVLDEDRLNYYYYEMLTKVLETGQTLFKGFRIWDYEVPWKGKNAYRQGWLFFGAPNERCTAQPPRDFYLYFLKPFGGQDFGDQQREDEVFFVLADRSEEFVEYLKMYAGAKEMASISSGESKRIYIKKADEEYGRKLAKWIGEHITTSYQVTYKGVTKRFSELLRGAKGYGEDVRELVNTVASNCLSVYFDELYSQYPTFPVVVHSKNREQYAKAAIDWIATNKKTELGAKILDALELLDGNTLNPSNSKYARYITRELGRRARGHVVNRKELIENIEGIDYLKEYRLEPEWVAVILTALVYSGDITLALYGGNYDASNIEELAKKPLEDIMDFKHIAMPKGFPLKEAKALCELLGLPPGLFDNEKSRENAVVQLQEKIKEIIGETVELLYRVADGVESFGVQLISVAERDRYKKELDSLKSFLESLQVYNTPGKMKNLKYTVSDIQSYGKAISLMGKVKDIIDFKRDMDPIAGYISAAEHVMLDQHPWKEEYMRFKQGLLANGISDKMKVISRMKVLRDKYIDEYIKLHQKMRLDAKDDERKKRLMADWRLQNLNKLKEIPLMQKAQLEEYQNRLGSLKTCYSLTKEDLNKNQICPYCHMKPSEEVKLAPAYGQLDVLEDKLEEMYRGWTDTLLENLEDPTVKGNIELLGSQVKERIEKFIRERELPREIDGEFIKGLKQALEGLIGVNISLTELEITLLDKGGPCTVDQLRLRFERFIESKVKGKDLSKVRIILEE